MEHDLKCCRFYAILILIFEWAYTLNCGGKNGTCCYMYRWDSEQGKCLPCEPGYTGQNCGARCSVSYHGLMCHSKCNCSDKDCDHVNGCRQLSTEIDKFKNTERNTTTIPSCNNNCKRDPPSTKPLMVGIIVLASMVFVIILITHRVELHQQSRTGHGNDV